MAEERDREREGSVGATKRRVLNREVSMKRTFKPREQSSGEIERKEKERAEEKQRAEEETRLAASKQKERNLGVTLVDASPVKPKAVRTDSLR